MAAGIACASFLVAPTPGLLAEAKGGTMPFPVSVEASMGLAQPSTSVQVDRILRRIQKMLDSAHASSISVVGPSVSFRSGLLPYLFRWGPLSQIASGRIDIERSESSLVVRYRLITLKASEAILIAAILAYAMWRSPTALSVATAVALSAWIAVGNYVIARQRFKALLHRWLVLSAAEYNS